jgi:hypothetical protein
VTRSSSQSAEKCHCSLITNCCPNNRVKHVLPCANVFLATCSQELERVCVCVCVCGICDGQCEIWQVYSKRSSDLPYQFNQCSICIYQQVSIQRVRFPAVQAFLFFIASRPLWNPPRFLSHIYRSSFPGD